MKSPELTATTAPTLVAPQERDRPSGSKMHLVRELLSPYRGWVTIILLAMVVETATSLAAPWPLKVILDNVVGTHKAPEWLAPFRSSLMGGHKMELAAPGGDRDCNHRLAGRRRELHR